MTAGRVAARPRPLRLIGLCVAPAVLAVLLWRLGAQPFVDGLSRLSAPAIVGAVALTAVATVAAAWRWTTVARALGGAVGLRAAVPACYRSQLLDSVLPGGVLGDVERGLRAAAPGARGRGLEAVAWERGIGQAVQLVLLVVLVPLGAPSSPVAAAAPAALVAAAVVVALVGGRRERDGEPRPVRAARAVRRRALLLLRRPSLLLGAVAASIVVVAAHAAVFVLAAGATGTTADPLLLLPVAVAVQAATALPTGFGGWGVREGAAATLFAAAGLDPAAGVAASIAAGVLALVAVLPGLAPLLGGRRSRPATAEARAR